MSALRRSRLYEQIADSVERRIREERIPPGEPLPSERELMKEFGVGRPAVREALFHLQKMGLIEIKSGARARVAAPTPKAVVETLSGSVRYLLSAPNGVAHLQGARLFLEIGLARYAAQFADVDDLGELETALEANHAALGDLARFERTDLAFHYVLAVIPDNPVFPALHAAFAEWLMGQRHVTLTWQGREGTALKAYQAHREIFEAIAARDADRAEEAMRAHLAHVSEVYREAMGQGR